MRLIPLGCLLALVPAVLVAQPSRIVYDHQTLWTKVDISDFNAAGEWGWGVDGIVRRKNELGSGFIADAPMRESIRPWLHRQITPTARLSISPIGLMHTTEYVGKPEDRDRPDYKEFRTTLQFFHHHKQLGGKLMHTWRYRYELRWQERPADDSYRYFNRLRLMYRVRYALNSPDIYQDGTYYAMAQSEIGLNTGRAVETNFFNQHRMYVGVGRRVLNSARVEVRYVDRFRSRGGAPYEFDHDRGLMLMFGIDQLRLLGSKDIPVRLID
jgi:hypothetical protein